MPEDRRGGDDKDRKTKVRLPDPGRRSSRGADRNAAPEGGGAEAHGRTSARMPPFVMRA